jgi:hypothetical protein
VDTVCETHTFRRAADEAGMTSREIADFIDFLAQNRVAGRGKGKSGGYRTITFYSGQEMPVYL